MADSLPVVPFSLWTLFFSCATHHIMVSGQIQMPECSTDYIKELVCQWQVDAQINCSEEYQFYYMDHYSTSSNICVPENGKDSGMDSTCTCICTILPEFFAAGSEYQLVLQANGTVLWNNTVEMGNIVKPKSLTNLTIKKGENDNFCVSWNENYGPGNMLHGEEVKYEVKYWNKQNPEESYVQELSYQTTSFEILARQLSRGSYYLISVRCKYPGYSSKWSEWSPAAEFYNDYGVTLEDNLQMVVLISCMLITALILICYFCFAKVKREWWDQIPNPAKSHLIEKNVKAAQFSVWRKMLSKAPFHDVKQSQMENQLRSCKNCLAKYAQGQILKGKDNIVSDEKLCSCLNKYGEWSPEEYETVLIPEIIPVEASLEVCECSTATETESHEDNLGETPIFQSQESSANSFMENTQHNDALANMFIELLECGTNIHDSEVPDFIIEEHKTFESCESENSSQRAPQENEVQDQQSYESSHACFFSTNTSQEDYNCSTTSTKSVNSEDSFESGYQSSNTDAISPEAKNPPAILHQNHFLFGSETQHDLLILIEKSPDAPISEIIKDTTNSPAYQSFSSPMFQSTGSGSLGYKSFDSVISQSTGSGSLGYKSFDSVISQSTGSGSLGYKSFDSVISQSTGSGSPGYKSFDSLISQSTGSCSPGYKSFDSVISQSMGSGSPGYKSFDIVISQSMGSGSPGYKSFDSVISQSTGSCSPGYKSFESLISQSMGSCSPGYKSFESLVSQSTESCSPGYKSLDSFVHQSMVSNSLTPCLENPGYSLSLAEFPENQILPCREEQAHQSTGDQRCYPNPKTDCTEPAFHNICSKNIDCPWFSTHEHDKISFFLPKKEVHKQIVCQNVPEKTSVVSCPTVSNSSSYQPFDIALKHNNGHCDNNSEAVSESPYKPFIDLLNNNVEETLPAVTICDADLEIKDCTCQTLYSLDSGVTTGFTFGLSSGGGLPQNCSDSLWIIGFNETCSDGEHEDTRGEKKLLWSLDLALKGRLGGP